MEVLIRDNKISGPPKWTVGAGKSVTVKASNQGTETVLLIIMKYGRFGGKYWGDGTDKDNAFWQIELVAGEVDVLRSFTAPITPGEYEVLVVPPDQPRIELDVKGVLEVTPVVMRSPGGFISESAEGSSQGSSEGSSEGSFTAPAGSSGSAGPVGPPGEAVDQSFELSSEQSAEKSLEQKGSGISASGPLQPDPSNSNTPAGPPADSAGLAGPSVNTMTGPPRKTNPSPSDSGLSRNSTSNTVDTFPQSGASALFPNSNTPTAPSTLFPPSP